MQPIVFLDFDGPIKNPRARQAGLTTDPVAVRTIHAALKTSGARLVIIANLRLSGREECVKVIDSQPGFELSPFLHADWAVGGTDEYPMAESRGQAIHRWIMAHDGEASWLTSLVIDDLPIRRLWTMAVQAEAHTIEGLNHSTLVMIGEWAEQRRAAA